MTRNLSEYFVQTTSDEETNKGNKEWMAPSVSMAVETGDEDEFERTTFTLKRTRSMGLLDEYIDPTRKLLERTATINNIKGLKDDQGDMENQDKHENSTSEAFSVVQVGLGSNSIEDSKSPPVPDSDSYRLPLDDIDVQQEPSRHVDYLSHNWEESDILQSWKYIILKKKQRGEQDLVNAARLENASWRTWAKAKNGLETVSPEMVNWSKDSDVTWLYGPIVRHNGKEGSNNVGGKYQKLGYGSEDETLKRMGKPPSQDSGKSGPKPILKKRSVSEIIEENSLWRLTVARQHRKRVTDANSIMDGCGNKFQHDDYDALAARVNSQYYVRTTNNNNMRVKKVSPVTTPLSSRLSSSKVLSTEIMRDATTYQQPFLVLHINNIESSVKKTRLPSILSSTKRLKDRQKDRHIHFNDRVEQCMAVNNQNDGDYFNDHEHEDYVCEDGSDTNYEREDTVGYNKPYLSSYKVGGSLNKFELSVDDCSDGEEDQDDEDEDEDEDEDGLFISATGRKAENSSNNQTEPSLYGSSVTETGNGYPMSFIIKMLPATTLNYGSDDDYFHGNDYYGGNAISHNVNTYRGYDYFYDYNSVYTADIPNFLAFHKCDIVDVPEALRTQVNEDPTINFRVDDSDLKQQDLQGPNTSLGNRALYANEDILSNSEDSAESTLTDSNGHTDSSSLYTHKNSQDNDLSLKRTHSLGKSHNGSLYDLQYGKPSVTNIQNFVTGKQGKFFKSGSLVQKPSQQTHPQRYIVFKHSSSSRSFTFDDSDSDSGSDFAPPVHPPQISHQLSYESNVRSPSSIHTRNTSISTSPKGISLPAFGTFCSGSSNAFLSDVDIPGYISPRNDSMQSVISKEKIIDIDNSTSGNKANEDVEPLKAMNLDSLSKTFENYHIAFSSAQSSEKYEHSNNVQQGSGRMMEMASKYLNSWKR